MVGTIRRNKPELPPELLEVRQRTPLSSLFAFTQTHTAVSYVPRRGKNVLLMSTKHRQPAISNAEHRKPVIILDYNKNKGGVDNLDKAVATYSCRRRTHRWPQKMFYNILDVSAFNSFVLWTCVHPQWKGGTTHKRRLFLEELGRALVTPLMLQRKRLPRNLSALAAVNTARAEQLEAKTEERGSPAAAVVRRQCHLCRKRIQNTCAGCGTRICRDHTKMLCSTCWS